MRELSEFEKLIVNKIIELDDSGALIVLNNILEYSFDDFDHMFIDNIDDCQCRLNIEKRYFEQKYNLYGMNGITGMLEGVNKKFIVIEDLFNYLITDGLVIATGELNFIELGIKGNTEYIKYSNLDKEVAYFLWKYLSKQFTPTQKLRKFVKNGFKTDQQLELEVQEAKNKKSFNFSLGALIVAILSLLSSILVPLLSTSDVKIVNDPLKYEISNKSIDDIGISLSRSLQNIPRTVTLKIKLDKNNIDNILIFLESQNKSIKISEIEKKQIKYLLNKIGEFNYELTEEQIKLLSIRNKNLNYNIIY